MKHNLEQVAAHYSHLGSFVDAQPYGSGHINDTYLVHLRAGDRNVPFIFQRINHRVFKNPPQLMANIVRVTRHIRSKLEAQGADQIERRVMTVLPTDGGGDFLHDEQGNYWRAYIFITGARTYDVLENTSQALQAARAFGQFQKMLVDLPAPALEETIPNFHNGPWRLGNFKKALEADALGRAAGARAEIDFVLEHQELFHVLPALVEAGRIPMRTTHNDTKINNVMLDDADGRGVCVIDLDTVMPGLALYDFGDIFRTVVSPAAEDEKDLSRVQIVPERFEAIVQGYLSTAGEFLNETEIEHLLHSGMLITLIVGTRFLTDFLEGDVYFKIHREGHNLDRSRTQLRLVAEALKNETALRDIVHRALPAHVGG